jgi:hypothetical protein
MGPYRVAIRFNIRTYFRPDIEVFRISGVRLSALDCTSFMSCIGLMICGLIMEMLIIQLSNHSGNHVNLKHKVDLDSFSIAVVVGVRVPTGIVILHEVNLWPRFSFG